MRTLLIALLVAILPSTAIASIDLTNQSGDTFRFGNMSWAFLLNLAERYGWKPAGTAKPEGWKEESKWPGNYDSSDGQTVTSDDAKALAKAVRAALEDKKLETRAKELEADFRRWIEERVGPELAKTYQVGLGKEENYRPHLNKFIEFCNKGPFMIE